MIHIGAEQPLDHRLQGHQRRQSRTTPIAAWSGSTAGAENVRNFTQCDSLLLGSECGAHTVPYIEVKNPTAPDRARGDHLEDQRRPALLRRCRAASTPEDAVALIVNGFAREVLKQLPMEFAVEAQKLLGISLEGSVG